jgi:hypothetical protein
MRPQSFLEGIARRLSVVSLRLSGRLQAVEECRDNNRALLWFSLKDQVGSIDAGDFDLRLDSSNLFEAGWPNQAVLLGLNEENRYCDLLRVLAARRRPEPGAGALRELSV